MSENTFSQEYIDAVAEDPKLMEAHEAVSVENILTNDDADVVVDENQEPVE